MSNQEKPKSPFTEPQIVGAIIGGLVTLIAAIVGILPNLLDHDAPPATAIIIITATPIPATVAVLPPTNTAAPAPTDTFLPTLTAIPTLADIATPTALPQVILQPPTEITVLAAAPLVSGNVLLLYDEVSLTLLNQSSNTLSLEGVIFRSATGEWDARRWGESLYSSLPAGMCLRLRDRSAGPRQPPAPCREKIYGLQEISGDARFWISVEQFDVIRGGQVIATCRIADQTCPVNIA